VETFGALIGVLGAVALMVGLIMFLPVAVFRARRTVAIWLTVGGIIAFAAGVIITPAPPQAGRASAATASAEPTTKPAETTNGAESKAAFVALYREILSAAKPCDSSVAALRKAAGSGNPYSTYEVAKRGADACREAAMSINDMEAPAGLSAEGRDAVTKSIETCRSAYLYRQTGMEKAMQAADGDARPSVVSEMSENMKTAQSGVMLCVAQLFTASQAVGVDPKQLR
jgi:hypothetical protein